MQLQPTFDLTTMNEYKIILDKERVLKYSHRAFSEFEKRIGKSVVSIFTEGSNEKDDHVKQNKLLAQFSSANFITDFIYCGLLHEKITYDAVMDMISPKHYMEIMTLAMHVLPEEFGLTGKAEDKKKEE